MKPISPVIPGRDLPEIVIAENQDEYGNLPAVQVNPDALLTRWKLSFRERVTLLLTGDLYVWLWNFGGPVQPLMIETDQPVIPHSPKDCGYACEHHQTYGFVPERGCPTHDPDHNPVRSPAGGAI